MLYQAKSAFSSSTVFYTARELAYGFLNCSGRSTITGFICGIGQQFGDWTKYYRLFSSNKIDIKSIMAHIFFKGIELSPPSKYVVVHMDDTIIKKTGKKVKGTAWRRDPLGPPFHTNFIWGQRFIKLSLAIPQKQGIGPSRAIPIEFKHCPTASKPSNQACESEIEKYKEQLKQMNLNTYGSESIRSVREQMNQSNMEDKKLVTCVDGSYTNGVIIKGLPENVSIIGRTRKDLKLNFPVDKQPHTGRRKIYGKALPTPEEIRKSNQYEWNEVEAWACGKIHQFNIKEVKDVLWRKTGADHRLRMIIIRPLGYRLRKNSRVLYRKPAYLLCNDLEMDIQDLIQFYVWRWEIEVNIGEAKSLLGVGQAQVRNEDPVHLVPAFLTAIYSLLHLAFIECKNSKIIDWVPRAKWYPKKENKRVTTGDLINIIKAQIHCKAIGVSFTHFINTQNELRSAKNSTHPNIYGRFYARA